MARHIPQMKDRSGQEIKTYLYKGYRVEVSSCFLYEVCINKYWKWGFCMLGNKFFKSDKLLRIKNTKILKYYKDYIIEKEISLIGVPYKFVIENNLPKFELNIKKKKVRKNERTC